MAYAEDLKSSGRKAVWVQLPPRVPTFLLYLQSVRERPFAAYPSFREAPRDRGSMRVPSQPQAVPAYREPTERPLFIIASEHRRRKVFEELRRPPFSEPCLRLNEVIRFLG